MAGQVIGGHKPLLPARRSLILWAVLAVFLVIFSYVFSILIAVAWVYFPYLLFERTGNLNAFLALLCGLVVAAVVLWSLIPRRDKLIPPGPLLNPGEHPRLFREIEFVAAALNEPMPNSVFLILDANAWVAQRGGLMGVGSKRVLAIGLPLFQILSVSELRAILAHEFGHYYSGDTRLGPWVYAARDSMVRSLQNLSSMTPLGEALSRSGIVRVVHWAAVIALEAYWKLYMRLTQVISRRQEYRADELACAVAGSTALTGGLRRIEAASAALPVFWQTEVIPALETGCRVPIAEGFAKFLAVPGVAGGVAEHLEAQLAVTSTGPYDSHPPLHDRLKAATEMGSDGPGQDPASAVALIGNLDGLESLLLASLDEQIPVSELKPVTWDQVGEEVYVRRWRAFVDQHSRLLGEATVAALPEVLTGAPAIAERLPDPKGHLLTREERLGRARSLVWIALALRLRESGWELHAGPGELYLERDGERLQPATIANEIGSGAISAVEWQEKASVLGISDLRLGPDAERTAGA